MCGIAGFYKPDSLGPDSEEIITRMLMRISHRGPDEMGYFVDDNIAFGNARLSIVDLAGGHQPMSDAEGRYWICFNGMIYNYVELRAELEGFGYRFATTSDTEALLYSWIHWREESLDKLNGPFAFAVYDSADGSLFLARDRFGKRPLYYIEKAGLFLFASEIKSLATHPDVTVDFDTGELATILTVWTPAFDQTGYAGIKQLPPGWFLKLDGSNAKRGQYFFPDRLPPAFKGSFDDAVAMTRHAMTESVKIRLRSDVKVGVYLSGGVDSAITTMLTAEISSIPVSAFSIGFHDADFDESREQAITSAHLGVDHVKIKISNDDIVNNFAKSLIHGETPVFRTAFTPMYLLSRLAREHGVKVVLTGEGSDEIFVGYDIFKEALLRSSWKSITADERMSLLSKVHPFLKHLKDDNVKYMHSLYEKFSTPKSETFFSHEMRFNASNTSLRLLKTKGDGLAPLETFITKNAGNFKNLDCVQKAQYLELATLLSGYLLSTQGDRMLMANSVEGRCPFLDPQVASLAASFPLEFKLKDFVREKHVLRKAFEDKLPAQIINRVKIPYRAPDAASFIGPNRPDYMELILSGENLKKIGAIDDVFAGKLVRKVMGSPPDKISPAESHAFMFILSIAILRAYFAGEMESPAPTATPPFKTRINRRRDAGAKL